MNKKLTLCLVMSSLTLSLFGCTSKVESEDNNKWNEELTNLLEEYAPKLDLPYFYFGETYESFFYDAYGSVSVVTAYQSNTLIDEANDAFTNDQLTWKTSDMSKEDGYPSYVYSTHNDEYTYEVDLYIKNNSSRMDIYCYPYFEDAIKDYLENVDPSKDIEFNHYYQRFEENSYLYSALEIAGDHQDAQVKLEDGTILHAGDLDYESLTITDGVRYDNCVYNALGHEYKKNIANQNPAYDSDYRINNYLNDKGLCEARWFGNYLGGGEYKNRELGYDIDTWKSYKITNGFGSDEEFFNYLLNLGQSVVYIENEMIYSVLYSDYMTTNVIKNVDGTTTCTYIVSIDSTWRESFGIYGIQGYPGLTKDMDAPFNDTLTCVATFDSNDMLINVTTTEVKTILASQVTSTKSPWYGKEDFVTFYQSNSEEVEIINAGNYESDLLFDEPMEANVNLGDNTVRCYEYIYGTVCTFTASESGTYLFKTDDDKCQLDFYTKNGNYIDSCFGEDTYEVTLQEGQSVYFHTFYVNDGKDFIFIGDVSFNISKVN